MTLNIDNPELLCSQSLINGEWRHAADGRRLAVTNPASGANLICFTTGRGSMFGSKPAPTIKLASNTAMYERLKEDMDINCGLVIDGEATMQQMGQIIFDEILRAASGAPTKSELLGLGDHEFIPWHLGVVS